MLFNSKKNHQQENADRGSAIVEQSEYALVVDKVFKRFTKQKQKTFKEFIPALLGRKSTHETFLALNDISFSIKRGETVGIIGPNGSGKSTLLKLIAGVSNPTSGTITISGRIAPLIELGAGFHPELTGRENVYLNGVILGMKRADITRKFSDIVDFAELWDFIDQPVKHYSSGMYLRLAFAVAVHTEPDVLLVDEILAVGDEKFQRKCFERMELFKKSGVSIILVSHNMEKVAAFCEKSILLEKSIILDMGESRKVIQTYKDSQEK